MRASVGANLERHPPPSPKMGAHDSLKAHETARDFIRGLKAHRRFAPTNDRHGQESRTEDRRGRPEQPLPRGEPLFSPGRFVEEVRQFVDINGAVALSMRSNGQAVNQRHLFLQDTSRSMTEQYSAKSQEIQIH
ncbi:hypothetical protein ACN2C7_16680 [Caulobacter sp. ErkDOM-E]|uniref:hypothetical protein n=1 Tax=Caulobacter sp. ErkDOM-E TaxID=3402778 RepID=UPI003AF93227